MKKSVLGLLLLLSAWAACSQTCTSFTFIYTASIPDNDPGGVTVNAPVVLPGVLGVQYVLDSVHVTINHTYVGDLKSILVSPAGDSLVLFDQPGVPASTYGCDNDNVDATFTGFATQYAETACNAGPALSGKYLSITPLASLQNGNVAGTWTLSSMDMAGSDVGMVQGLILYFTPLWYPDADGDNYGGPVGVRGCTAPANHIPVTGDCNDNNADIHPFAVEICGNKIDEDCTGADADYLYQTTLQTEAGSGFCAGDSALILISPFAAGDSVIWYYNQNVLPVNTGNFLYASQPGSYTAYIVMANGCYYIPNVLSLEEYPLPQPGILATEQGLYAGVFETYAWFLNGQPIPAANDPYWVPQADGSYTVAVTDTRGCTGLSAPFAVAHASLNEFAAPGETFTVYPNPAQGLAYVQTENGTRNLDILDLQGKTLRNFRINAQPYTVDLQGLAPGMYLLRCNGRVGRLMVH